MGRFLDDIQYTPTGEYLSGRPMHRLLADFRYEVSDGYIITAPRGFVFDLGSVPRILWFSVSPWDSIRAYLVHDYLYRTGIVSRSLADAIFRQAMADEGKLPAWKRWAVWAAVRVNAGAAYRSYRVQEERK